jgi:hypothetical protein
MRRLLRNSRICAYPFPCAIAHFEDSVLQAAQLQRVPPVEIIAGRQRVVCAVSYIAKFDTELGGAAHAHELPTGMRPGLGKLIIRTEEWAHTALSSIRHLFPVVLRKLNCHDRGPMISGSRGICNGEIAQHEMKGYSAVYPKAVDCRTK